MAVLVVVIMGLVLVALPELIRDPTPAPVPLFPFGGIQDDAEFLA